MRPHTLSAHLSIPEDSLRNERIQVADQLKLVRKLREEGRDESAAMEVLQYELAPRKGTFDGSRSMSAWCHFSKLQAEIFAWSSLGSRST